MLKQRKILLTGASGWFGRSFISEYIKQNGVENIRQLTLVTSDGRELIHPQLHVTLKTVTFDDACKFSDYDTIIQSSFVTRDKIGILGAERYSAVCEEIIESARAIIQQNLQAQVFLISSGAVYNDQSLYGRYKRLEEETFKSTKQQNLKIFRTFGATTRFMDYRSWSAICNFIKASTLNYDIKIQSNHEILRSIVCMEDLSNLIIKLIFSTKRDIGTNIVCDAVSDIVSIRDLAKLCIGYKNKIILPDDFNESIIDKDYIGDPTIFKQLAKAYKVKLKSPEQQIKNAVNNPYRNTYK